ncbi:AMP-binding domain-containing protein [Aphelenchoides besseyi]|nr:AMP-binding domain-containing protein [Aphelenchoides besseyi]
MTRFYEWQNEAFELVETADFYDQFRRIVDELKCTNTLIGICLPKSAKLAVSIDAIQRSGNAFCWFDPTATWSIVKNRCLRLRTKILIANQPLEWSIEWKEVEPRVFVAQLPFSDDLNAFGCSFVYAICTSGSTGDPKAVLVPPASIRPNILHFIELFGLNERSRLMWSTNLDFDPSFLELLIAIEAKCDLYIVSDQCVKQIWPFTHMILIARPHFLQITPAVLSLFSADFLSLLFGPNSPVKYVLIGGETFPVSLVKRYFQSTCESRIFNTYGLTEVSCWASCTEFHPKIDNHADASNPIRDTELIFGPNGVEIYGRGCVVNGESQSCIHTGDHFIEVEENGRKKFSIMSRDKINGEVVTREVEDYVLSEFPQVEAARLVVYDNQRFLFLQAVEGCNDQIDRIPTEFHIRNVFHVDKLPMTPNGKIDDQLLRSQIQAQKIQFTGTVATYLQNNKKLRESDATVSSQGFSSRDLFEFIFEFSQKHPHIEAEELNELRVRVFDEKTPIQLLFELFDSVAANERTIEKAFIECLKISEVPSTFSASLRWKFSMRRCVDFTPVYHQSKVFVGDMDGYFVVLKSQTGDLLHERKHEAAIIAKCAICGTKVVYCTVDGEVHVVDYENFDSFSVKVGESIRSEPTILNDNHVFVATFTSNLMLLNVNTMTVVEVCHLNSTTIRNAPLVLSDFVVVASVEGEVAAFKKQTFKIKWRRRFNSAVFVSPFQLSEDFFGILTLNGDLQVFLKPSNCEVHVLWSRQSCALIQLAF